MEHQLDRVSPPIVIIHYQDRWHSEFREAARRLRQVLGDLAARIDHVGSTSVPGLAAKDIIDIQITVEDLGDTEAFRGAMVLPGGYRQRVEIHEDHLPLGADPSPAEWRKLYFRSRGSQE